MRIPTSPSRFSPLRSHGLLWLLLASLLGGCASKNPLMEEPAPGTLATAPAEPDSPAPTTAETGEAGVQTVKQRRFLGFLSPYRPDIQQGNFVSREMVAQLREGMTPEQVRFILGTPLLTDIFHANRWDYPFRLVKGNGEITTSRVTVFFNEDRLARVVGGDLPTEADYLARIADKAKPSGQPAVPQAQTAEPEMPSATPGL